MSAGTMISISNVLWGWHRSRLRVRQGSACIGKTKPQPRHDEIGERIGIQYPFGAVEKQLIFDRYMHSKLYRLVHFQKKKKKSLNTKPFSFSFSHLN